MAFRDCLYTFAIIMVVLIGAIVFEGSFDKGAPGNAKKKSTYDGEVTRKGKTCCRNLAAERRRRLHRRTCLKRICKHCLAGACLLGPRKGDDPIRVNSPLLHEGEHQVFLL